MSVLDRFRSLKSCQNSLAVLAPIGDVLIQPSLLTQYTCMYFVWLFRMLNRFGRRPERRADQMREEIQDI